MLFIFDGYDEIEDIHAFHSLNSKEEIVKHNFFELNKIHGESWKNAKFIITCREEDLQKVERRDLLFGPLDCESDKQTIKLSSFLERTIEPFLDGQITSYLKKYSYFKQLGLLPDDPSQDSNSTITGSSWYQVQQLEKMIDNYHLREIARVPFMLCIICQILPKMTSEEARILSGDDSLQSKVRRIRFLRDFVVSETIKTNLESTMDSSKNPEETEESKSVHEEVRNQKIDSYIEAINRQTQGFALRLSGYSINERKTQYEVIDDPSSILNLHPFAKWGSKDFRVQFQYPFIREFYIAKSIAEEIREKVPSPSSALQDEKLEISRDLLINQRLLTCGASNSIVLLLLRDAVNDKRLTTEQLMKLVEISREKGGVKQESNFSAAAATQLQSSMLLDMILVIKI